MVRNIPKKPKEEMFNKWNTSKIIFHFIICFILILLLIFTVFNILYAYVSFLIQNGLLHKDTLKYALLILAGSYVVLIVDRNKIRGFLKIKSVDKLELRTILRKNEKNR